MVEINATLWTNYLTRRGVKADVAAKLAAGKEVKVKNGVESADADAVTVTLSDGLDLKEEGGLGITRTEDDARMAAGWNVEHKDDQTGEAANAIDENELTKHEATVKDYADAHGIGIEEAANLYHAKPLGTENFTEVKVKRVKAEQDTQKDYDDWKAKNNNGSFAQYLVARGVPSNSWIHHLGFGNQSPQGFVHAVFSSSFPLEARKSAYNTDDPAPGYNYDSYGYDAAKMMDWAIGKQPVQTAQTGAPATANSAAAQNPNNANAAPPPATSTLPAPPKEMKDAKVKKNVSGAGVSGEGAPQYPIYTLGKDRYVKIDGLYYKVDEKNKDTGGDTVVVDSTPKYQDGGINPSAAASPPPPPVVAAGQQPPVAQGSNAPSIPEPPKDMQKRTIKVNNENVEIYSSGGKAYLKTGSKYYEITNMNNYSGGLNTAEKPSFEDKTSDTPSQGGTNYMPQVGYQPGNRAGNVSGYRLPGQ